MNNKKSIKIIFLDVDGVLNCSSTKDRCGPYIGIEDKKVKLLKEIVKSTKAKIVLVSTWKENWYVEKRNKDKQDFLADYLDQKIKKQRLVIMDKTDDYMWSDRGSSIIGYLNYLKQNNFNVKNKSV